jgi:uncharacterized protein with GYD domain
MATYVLLSTLTPEGRQTLHAHPERVAEVNKEIAEFGCRVLQQYALLGGYDFLTVTRRSRTCRSTSVPEGRWESRRFQRWTSRTSWRS